MRARKGHWFFAAFLDVLFLIVLVYAFTTLSAKQAIITDQQKFIGSNQLELYGVYQEAENALFYLDQAGKYAAEEAVYELGAENTGCGFIEDLPLWENMGEECHPSQQSFKEEFSRLFNKNLRKYSSNYKSPAKTQIRLPFSYKMIEDNEEVIMQSEDFLVIGKYHEKTIASFSGKTVALGTCEFAGLDSEGNYDKLIGESTATRPFAEGELITYRETGYLIHPKTAECVDKMERITDGKFYFTSNPYRTDNPESNHFYGQAVDFAIEGKTSYEEMAIIAQQAGCFTYVYNEETPCLNRYGELHGTGNHIHGSVGPIGGEK